MSIIALTVISLWCLMWREFAPPGHSQPLQDLPYAAGATTGERWAAVLVLVLAQASASSWEPPCPWLLIENWPLCPGFRGKRSFIRSSAIALHQPFSISWDFSSPHHLETLWHLKIPRGTWMQPVTRLLSSNLLSAFTPFDLFPCPADHPEASLLHFFTHSDAYSPGLWIHKLCAALENYPPQLEKSQFQKGKRRLPCAMIREAF